MVATRQLWHALISAETHAWLLADELRKLQLKLEHSPPPDGMEYWAEAEDGATDEATESRRALRAEQLEPRRVRLRPEDLQDPESDLALRAKDGVLEFPAECATWYGWYDVYHRLLRSFRRAVEDAKRSSFEASKEIDGADAAPLDRVTTKIRQSLQRLNGCVPYPMTYGDYPPREPVVPARLMEARGEITVWIEQLRAVLPAHAAAASATARESAPEVLPPSHEEVLVALLQLGAIDPEHRSKAEKIALKKQYDNEPNLVKHAVADLGRWGLVRSKEGRGGGTWLLGPGLERARRLAAAPQKL